MNYPKPQLVAFGVLISVAAVIVILMFWPFLKFIAMAGILAVLFTPMYDRIHQKIGSESWSAFTTLIIAMLIVLVPLYILGQLLFNEITNQYFAYKAGGSIIDVSTIIHNLPLLLQSIAERFIADITQRISGLTSNAFNSFTSVVSNIAEFFFALFFVFFTLYYFLKEGKRIKLFLAGMLPLSAKSDDSFFKEIEGAINGVVKGAFLIALLQGGVALVGFLLFGVPQPFLWAMFTVLAALVPTFGTSLAIIPAVLYLVLTGNVGAGIGMAIWGALAVGMIDNLISPRLIASRTNLHPLLILLSILGGLQFFGILGFLIGPIITAVFVALVNIYREDLKEALSR